MKFFFRNNEDIFALKYINMFNFWKNPIQNIHLIFQII